MKMPRAPLSLPHQRFDNRLWDTNLLMEVLAVYFGILEERYSVTWEYRTLIRAHRVQHAAKVYTKGYGHDWKNLSKCLVDGVERLLAGDGISIKGEVVDYMDRGKLPLEAMKLATPHVRDLEMQLWKQIRLHRAAKTSHPIRPLAEAAE